MKRNRVILVNPGDKKIGTAEKILAHQYAMLHRAFSVFIFRKKNNQQEVLLQQRSLEKYHAPGLWTNTCCSHPQPHEKSVLSSAQKRLKEEMGIEVKLQKRGMFHYVACFNNGLFENEMDHVFIGHYDAENIPVNKDEVADYKWVEVGALQKDLQRFPKKYTPWLKEALGIALS